MSVFLSCIKQHLVKICATTGIAAISVYLYYYYQKSLENSIKLSKQQINSIFDISSRNTELPSTISTLFLTNYSTNKYYIEYNAFLSNHLAHGIIALHRLQSDNATIKLFMKEYANKLEKANKILYKIEACDWITIDSYLGQRRNYYGIFKMMENDLDITYSNDTKHLIRSRFPLVSTGVSGAAFHGLIHLGYGVSVNNKQLILEGMTYITHSYLEFKYCPTNINPNKSDLSHLYDLLKLIKKDDILRKCVMNNYTKKEIISRISGAFQRGMISLSLYGQETISNYVQMIENKIPKMNSNSINDFNKLKKWLLSTMITLYTFGNNINYNDFFLLHGVTSAWCLLQILQCLNYNDINKSIVSYICGVIALYVVQGSHDVKICSNPFNNNNDKIKNEIAKMVYNEMINAKNGQFQNEHVYKLIQVILDCLQQDIIDKSCAYFAIAKSVKSLNFASITTS